MNKVPGFGAVQRAIKQGVLAMQLPVQNRYKIFLDTRPATHKIPTMTYSGLAVSAGEITIQKEGAQLFKAALSTTQLREFEIALAAQPRDHAGVRLFGIPKLRPFLSSAGPAGTGL